MLAASSPPLAALLARSAAARVVALATVERSRQVLDRAARARVASAVARARSAGTRARRRPPLYARIKGAVGARAVEVIVRRDGSVSTTCAPGGPGRGTPLTAPTGTPPDGAPPADALRATLWAARACDRVHSVELYAAGQRTPGRLVAAYARFDPEHPADGAPPAPAFPLLRTEIGESDGEGGGEHVLYLRGELDLSSAEHVRAAVLDAVGSKLVVDLSGLTFMDAAGLNALLTARREAEARGHELRIRGARGIVQRVFDVVGLGGALDA